MVPQSPTSVLKACHQAYQVYVHNDDNLVTGYESRCHFECNNHCHDFQQHIDDQVIRMNLYIL